MRFATTSVSVSEVNCHPSAISRFLSGRKFSMMPLWMSARRRRASTMGWALRSVGGPWVARRGWPRGWRPLTGCFSSFSFRRSSFPLALRVCSSPSRTATTPAESYPRYSRRRRPSISRGTTSRCPTYPTIPHIALLVPFLGLPGIGPPPAEPSGPAFEVLLPHPSHRQSSVRDILGDDRPGRRGGAGPYFYGRHQHGVAADEGAGADLSRMLLLAVVVAGDHARADVGSLAHRSIPHVGEMVGLGPLSQHGILHLDEVAHPGSPQQTGCRP